MPIYEEKDKVDGQKRYYVRVYINGKQVTRHNKLWVGRDGKYLAQQEEHRLRGNVYEEPIYFNLDDLFEKYFEDLKLKSKESTIRKTLDNYNLHIKPYLGFKKIEMLSNRDILDYHNILLNKKIEIKNDKSKRNLGVHNLSITFLQSIHTTLSAILNFGCKYYGLEKNVAASVGNFTRPKGTVKKEMNFLTIDEFNKFISFELNEYYKDFFTILFKVGLRRGELLALTIKDVDFNKKTININKSLNPKNGIKSTVPKTNKSNRNLLVTDEVINILKKYKDKENEIFSIDLITPTTLSRKCDRNCKSANIEKNIRIHDFRHSFASMCIFSGVPIEIISQYLGHENISTTLDTYSHLYPNSQDKLIEILNKQDQKQDQK